VACDSNEIPLDSGIEAEMCIVCGGSCFICCPDCLVVLCGDMKCHDTHLHLCIGNNMNKKNEEQKNLPSAKPKPCKICNMPSFSSCKLCQTVRCTPCELKHNLKCTKKIHKPLPTKATGLATKAASVAPVQLADYKSGCLSLETLKGVIKYGETPLLVYIKSLHLKFECNIQEDKVSKSDVIIIPASVADPFGCEDEELEQKLTLLNGDSMSLLRGHKVKPRSFLPPRKPVTNKSADDEVRFLPQLLYIELDPKARIIGLDGEAMEWTSLAIGNRIDVVVDFSRVRSSFGQASLSRRAVYVKVLPPADPSSELEPLVTAQDLILP